MSEAFQLALSKAKIKIMAHPQSCFLANVALRMKYVMTDEATLSTDGPTMFIGERFFLEKVDADMRASCLLHEVGHVVRDHMGRRGTRNPSVYNQAGDYVINQELKDSGFKPIKWKLDNGVETEWLQDDQYKGMDTETVYDLLMQKNQNQPPPSGMFDDLKDPSPGETRESVSNQITDIIVAAVQAADHAGQAGTVPGEVRVFVDGLLNPKLPLAHHLRRFFKVLDNSRYTWNRPNRRYRAHGYYLPTRQGSKLCHIAFAFDMSGSVSDADTNRYVSEMVGVLKGLKPSELTLVQFDTEIIAVDKIRSVDDLRRINLTGRGGTYIEPLMKWAEDEKPHALVVFTDGHFAAPRCNPGIPVLWMFHDKGGCTPSFGQLTYFEV